MWKSQVGIKSSDRTASQKDDDDDFDTDPDYVNDATEKQMRWGRVAPDTASVNFQQLSQVVQARDSEGAKKAISTNPAYGYGGKFGVEKDRMDKTAVGHDHQEKLEKHASQIDYAKGFGGKYGVQDDRKDHSAVGWEHQEKVEKHSSQTDYAKGFGGRYGVQGDRQDKSAVGWSHVEKTEKHASQKDYSHGFGGKFGVQTDRKDASAHDWDTDGSTAPKPSATPNRPSGPLTDTKSLRSRFEAMAVSSDNSQSDAIAKQRAQRKEQEEKERQAQRSANVPPVETKVVSPPVPAPVVSQTQRHIEPVSAPQPVQPSPVPAAAPPYQPPVEVKKEPEDDFQETWDEQKTIPKQETHFQEPEDHQEEYYQYSQTPANDHNQEPAEDLGITAIALYDYEPAEGDELGFDPGDLITHIEKIDEGWWKGSCRGRVGLFPANYVQEN